MKTEPLPPPEGPSRLSPEGVIAMEEFARNLRNGPRTLPERIMRLILDTYFADHHFEDQIPVHNRVADFYSRSLNAIIEVDGPYHNSDSWWVAPDGYKERALRKRGFHMVRFPNRDVIEAPEWVIVQLRSTLPIFQEPITATGPYSPVGLLFRLQRNIRMTSIPDFALEMEPCFETIAPRVLSCSQERKHSETHTCNEHRSKPRPISSHHPASHRRWTASRHEAVPTTQSRKAKHRHD